VAPLHTGRRLSRQGLLDVEVVVEIEVLVSVVGLVTVVVV
jgi:hypothetical protein